MVVALVRWGLDGSHYPDEPALGVARHLANLGATLVVGSHPLLQQDHAYFGNTLILFSAGPFYRPTTHSDLCWPQVTGVHPLATDFTLKSKITIYNNLMII